MKPQDKIAIENLRLQGVKPGDIALRLHLSPNTVRSHIRRHPQAAATALCPQCGKPLVQSGTGRRKKFCSDACRLRWWNDHQENVQKRAYYTLQCRHCGKEFVSYGNKDRKFCCRECYRRSLKGL